MFIPTCTYLTRHSAACPAGIHVGLKHAELIGCTAPAVPELLLECTQLHLHGNAHLALLDSTLILDSCALLQAYQQLACQLQPSLQLQVLPYSVRVVHAEAGRLSMHNVTVTCQGAQEQLPVEPPCITAIAYRCASSRGLAMRLQIVGSLGKQELETSGKVC